MSPPLTNFQTNTTTSTTTSPSNQSSGSVPHQTHLAQTANHYNHQQIPYGTALHPQMYPSGNVPFIQHYPISSFIPTAHGQQLIPQTYIPHGDRSDLSGRDANIGIQEHQSNSQHAMNSTRGSSGIGRRGRSRGGNNSMSRRDFTMRQHNQHQQQQQQNQSSITSNEYGQPLMDQNQAVLASSGQYQQLYIHYSPYYPNAGGPHLTALPASASAANAQNLTGQPLFAIQQPMHMYPYGSYPIMYNMMPTQGHPMSHQTTEMVDNEHNQNQDPNGAPTIIQSMPWPPHVAYQDPQQIFQHSPQLNPGEELEFRVSHPEEYHLQMINHPDTSYHIIAPEQNDVNEILQVDSTLQEDGFAEPILIEDEQMYHQEVAENGGDTRILVEKTRSLMIQPIIEEAPMPQQLNSQRPEDYLAVSNENNKVMLDTAVPNPRESESFLPNSPARLGMNVNLETEPTKSVSSSSKKNCTVDNKMIVKNKEKPPAWGNVAVPNLAQTSSVKKQMASVSVSAIPNKDVLHLQHASEIATQTNDQTMDAQEAVQDQHISNQTSFSSITASKLPLSSPTIAVNKKTEKKQNEIQPLQKQMALSDRVKQQIVTTITGVGQETNKKQDVAVSRGQQASTETVQVPVENITQASKPPPATQQASSALPSWAALFVSAESLAAASKATPPLPVPAASPMHNLNTENQTKVSTAKPHPEPLSVHVTPQVPGVMSYSAVSAQSMPASSQNFTAPVTVIASQLSTGGISKSKKLPQSKSESSSVDNNIGNNSKPTPVDQHSLRLGGSSL